MDKVYVVVADGYVGRYGCDMYLIGVFDKKENAEKATITQESINPNIFIKIMEIEKNKTFSLKNNEVFGIFTNDYNIGGYIE